MILESRVFSLQVQRILLLLFLQDGEASSFFFSLPFLTTLSRESSNKEVARLIFSGSSAILIYCRARLTVLARREGMLESLRQRGCFSFTGE